jgi:hypothetical protein
MIRYIWLKELKAELYTWKSTLWLLIASLIFSFTSYLLLTNKELSLLDQTELLWLLSKIIIGVAFLIVTIDASSIITTEFEKETAETLFLAPIRLRDFILAKLLASLTLWVALYIVAVPYMLVTSAGTNLAPAFLGYVALLGTLGGSTSTDVTNSPRVIFRDHCERSSGGVTLMSVGVSFSSTCLGAALEIKTLCARGEAARTASLINLMCEGVVPQQPPMNFAPAWIKRLANFDMYSGEHM